mmetsp:Transcript_29873/g.76641  ORF Transcript_29873/g.76641 Transcript_29873/m.76641 type:complete len:311 (+) Transcript_29873:142-1074(+)
MATPKVKSLEGFTVERILSEDAPSKSVAILGTFSDSKDGDKAIVKLSKRHFQLDSLHDLFQSGPSLQLDFENDIYSKFSALADPKFNQITVDTIYPCTAKHIAKHTAATTLMFTETSEMYHDTVQPYIKGLPTSQIQWVHNILEGTKEADRVIMRDDDPLTGFTLLPDLKWDQSQTEQLYCVAIVNRRDLASIRDLRQEHMGLLSNIMNAGCSAIKEKFGVDASQLKIYFHYYPSYFHLHCHFSHTSLGSIGNGAGKGHLLADVMNNIKLFGSDYYQRTSLAVEVRQDSELINLFQNETQAGKKRAIADI